MKEIDIYCFALKIFIPEYEYVRCTNCEKIGRVCLTSNEITFGSYDKFVKKDIRNKKLDSL
ncbi:hypothetical protein M0Q50_09685 [bacterium]|jgi:hypothetical protein|nr:hypothetical protein [bacterium]